MGIAVGLVIVGESLVHSQGGWFVELLYFNAVNTRAHIFSL